MSILLKLFTEICSHSTTSNVAFIKNFNKAVSTTSLCLKRGISTSHSSSTPLSSFDGKQIINQRKHKPIRRALLYVPGHDVKKINKIPQLNVDCAVLDCEDGVAADKKDEARSTIHQLYSEVAEKSSGDVCVRINSPSSGLAQQDIEALFSTKPYPRGLVVPKVDEYEEIQWVCDMLHTTIKDSRPAHLNIGIILMTESAKGLLNLRKIIESGISSCARNFSACCIDGVIFGSDDFCADLGITRSHSAMELTYARQKVVATAKAFCLQAIDMVYIDYKDEQGLKEQATDGFRMGFTGKQVIHPGQIPVVQNAFVPDKEKIDWALKLLEAFDESNEGVFTFRGQMIDLPTILQAQNIANLNKFINEGRES